MMGDGSCSCGTLEVAGLVDGVEAASGASTTEAGVKDTKNKRKLIHSFLKTVFRYFRDNE